MANEAQRRYLWRMGVAMAIYVASLFLAQYLVSQQKVSGGIVWALALVPGLAIAGAVYALGMLIIEQTDEFIRMLVIRQVLIGTGITLALTAIWGFLEHFDLVRHIDAYWVVILWFFGVGLGSVVNRITHGSWGQLW